MEQSAVTKLSSRVWRVMGLNPGPMTLTGTNTYLVGTGARRCLVDTGEGVASYKQCVVDALAAASADRGLPPVEISTVLLTHWHRDHVGGLPQILSLFPSAKLYKIPSACAGVEEDVLSHCGSSPLMNPLRDLPVENERPVFRVDDETTLEVVFTPGHTDDHMTLRLREENALFTGDCILGAGSSVFACYAEYMASLESIRLLEPSVLYPGHGPMVADAMARIQEQIGHRANREQQILAAMDALMRGSGERGGVTIAQIVDVVYRETPVHLHPAASINVLHHMKKLLRDKRCGLAATPPQLDVVNVFLAMGDYDGGEGSTVDVAVVTNVVRNLRWVLA